MRWLPGKRSSAIFWVVIGLAGVIILVRLAAPGQLERLASWAPDPTGSLGSRATIWRLGSNLIGDYIFTGAGLASFPLAFSIYGLLIHVPYHESIHNLYMEVWFEQGLVGLAVMVWMMVVIAGWAWRGLASGSAIGEAGPRIRLRALGWAGLAALAVMGVHGLVDVVFYTKRSMPLVGLVLGLAYLVTTPLWVETERQAVGRRAWKAVLLVCGLAALLGLVSYRQALAGWYANLGALAQTRLELGVYDPDRFDRPTLDEIRRTLDLRSVEASFQRALRYDSNNLTAVQRLGEIALSRGDYPQALRLLQAAWDSGYRDDITRLLLGDALIATGDPQATAEMIGGLDRALDRVLFQAWYRYWINQDYQRAADAWETALLLDPGNSDFIRWQNEARKRASGSEP